MSAARPAGASSGPSSGPVIPSSRSIRWYRWVGLAALVVAGVSFFTAVIAQLTAPDSPAARAAFWTALAGNLFCLIVLPGLLLRAIRVRRLARKAWRQVLMRAVWGGPFGTLGALWDLCADPVEAASSATPAKEAARGA